MTAVLLLAVLSVSPREYVVRDKVTVIEVNHFFNGQTRSLEFDQLIFWDYYPYYSEYYVVDWRLLKNVRDEDGLWIGGDGVPRRSNQGGYVSRWYDHKHKCYREVIAPASRETWTTYDPELDDRSNISEEDRRGLMEPKGE